MPSTDANTPRHIDALAAGEVAQVRRADAPGGPDAESVPTDAVNVAPAAQRQLQDKLAGDTPPHIKTVEMTLMLFMLLVRQMLLK